MVQTICRPTNAKNANHEEYNMENKALTFSTKVECADVVQDNRISSQRKSVKFLLALPFDYN